MKVLTSVLAALWTLMASHAVAQSSPVVVELYTSQGCSSCPPADKILHKLADRDDVIALALHVDYWDYIGWKDEYADPAYTARQKRYASVSGRKMVYTPQMIVNGQEDVVGNRAMDVADAIARHKQQQQPVELQASRMGDTIRIQAEMTGTRPKAPMVVHLVRFTPERRARITRGENAGRELTYTNIVDDWTVVAKWDGRTALDIDARLQGDRPAVVLIQQKGPGPIVAAARID